MFFFWHVCVVFVFCFLFFSHAHCLRTSVCLSLCVCVCVSACLSVGVCMHCPHSALSLRANASSVQVFLCGFLFVLSATHTDRETETEGETEREGGRERKSVSVREGERERVRVRESERERGRVCVCVSLSLTDNMYACIMLGPVPIIPSPIPPPPSSTTPAHQYLLGTSTAYADIFSFFSYSVDRPLCLLKSRGRCGIFWSSASAGQCVRERALLLGNMSMLGWLRRRRVLLTAYNK